MAIRVTWQETGREDIILDIPADAEYALEQVRLSKVHWDAERQLLLPDFPAICEMVIDFYLRGLVAPALSTYQPPAIKSLQDQLDAAKAQLWAFMLASGTTGTSGTSGG